MTTRHRIIVQWIITVLCLVRPLTTRAGAWFYVTPSGAGARDGSSWDDAFGGDDLQTAIDQATTAGDAMLLRHGVYTNSAQITVTNHSGLTIRGGYEGVGAPGGFSAESTVLTRDPAADMRIVHGQDAVLTLDRLTVTGGDKLGTGGEHRYGAGVYLLNCTTIITNCIIRNNELLLSGSTWSLYGAGLYARNGNLTMIDSVIADNRITSGNWNRGAGFYTKDVDVEMLRVDVVNNRLGGNSVFYGAGIGLEGGSALIVDSLFGTNRFTSGHQHEGGAIWASGASPLTISNSTFRGNYMAGSPSNRKEGGAIWAQNSADFTLVDSKFEGNYSTGGDPRRGSALYIGSTVSGLIADCTIMGANTGNGHNQVWINSGSSRILAVRNLHVQPGTATTGDGIRMEGSGTLALTNLLVHGFAGDGIQMDNEAGTLGLVNATLADNGGCGLRNAYGTVAVINSIAWGNTAGGFLEDAFGDLTVSYSSSQEAHAGDGNRVGDPDFVDSPAGDYRLTVASDCADAGSNAPWDGVVDAVDLDNEPRIRHGRVDRPLRIDMGAYERLIEVSDDLAVASHAASDVLPGEATANGMLLGAGNADDANVYVCWGAFDGGTGSTGNWTHVEFVGVYSNTFESFDHILKPLDGGSDYFYRFHAANSVFEVAWSDLQSFTTIAPPSVTATDATHIGRDVTTLRAEVTSTGGYATEAGFAWWVIGGAQTSTVSRGTQSDSYAAELTGLSPDTEYAFRAWASNVAGTVWSAQTHLFTTLDETAQEFYITPDGAGLENGADWGNAYRRNDLQFLMDIAGIDGDQILMRHGVYTNLLQTVILNRPGLTIRGGYQGSGTPGDFSGEPTVLTRNPDFQTRILLVTNSVLTLDRLTIRGGDMEGSGTDAYGAPDRYGAGLYLRNSTTVITNCVIRDNVRTSADYGSGYRGGGIYALGGSLMIVDSELINNALGMSSGHTLDGGGIYAQNVSLVLRRVEVAGNRTTREIARGMGIRLSGGNALIADSIFATNRTAGGAYRQKGAGIFADNTSPLTITNCVFVGNYLSGGSGHSGQPRAGAGIWVNNSADFMLVDTRFEGQYVTATHADTPPNHGSAIFLASGVGGEIRNCEIVGANTGGGMQQVWINAGSPRALAVRNLHAQPGSVTTGSGIRMQGSGALALTNVLVHGFAQDGVQMDHASGTLNLVNATLADNAGWGVSKAAGTVSIINSIAWNNIAGCFQNPDEIRYSSGQAAHAGSGNIQGDPIFEPAAGNYRLSRPSACVDAGSNTPWAGMADPRDLDGGPRIRVGHPKRQAVVDMGAYELPAPRGTSFMVR